MTETKNQTEIDGRAVVVRTHEPRARYRGISAARETLAEAIHDLREHLGRHTCAVILTPAGRYSPSVNITGNGRGADDHSRSKMVDGSTLSVPEGCADEAQEIVNSLTTA